MAEKKFDYNEIAPYENQAFEDAMERLRNYPQFLNNFTDIISRHSRVVNKWKSFHSKNILSRALNNVHSVDDFQKQITSDIFLNMIESSSIDHLTCEGIDELEDRPYIYISSHRDIVLDTALLDLVLYRSSRMLCEMVIGNNLISNQFIEDMFRVNGGILTNRNLSGVSELKNEINRLSYYINYCITQKKKSVWIAQKNGRSKDGIDNTSAAIIKMLYLCCKEQGLSFKDFLKVQPIVPVAISYQFDPCDVTKSQEQIRKLKSEGCYDVYKKKKYEDIIDLIKGLRCWKGNVHIHIGKVLDAEKIENPSEAVRECDRQIHKNFFLWDTNYFCYDALNGTNTFEDRYSSMNVKSFVKKYRKLNPQVVKNVYLQYANPVISMLNEEN